MNRRVKSVKISSLAPGPSTTTSHEVIEEVRQGMTGGEKGENAEKLAKK
jgi:hypothetical protein